MQMRARDSFHALGQFVPAGAVLNASDPIVKRFPDLFEPVAGAAPVVEQATAAPGEKRSTTRRTRKATA